MESSESHQIDIEQKYRIINWIRSFGNKSLSHLFDHICQLSHSCFLSEEWKSGVFLSEIVAFMINGDKQMVKQVIDKNIPKLVLAGTEAFVKSRAQALRNLRIVFDVLNNPPLNIKIDMILRSTP